MTLVQKNASRPSTSRQARGPAKIHKEVLLTLGGDDDDEDELVIRQLQIKEAKGPNDPNNIINIAKRRKTLTRMEICELFAEVVTRVEMCDTFDLRFWLDKYLEMSQIIDFAKISILLFDSAQIWGRKVDGLYEMINNFHSVQLAVEEHQVEVIKKRIRKEKEPKNKTEPVKKLKQPQKQIIPKINLDYRIPTIKENIINRESLEMPNLGRNQLSDIIKSKNTEKELSLRQKLFGIKNIKKFNDRRKRRIPIFDEIFKVQRNSFFLSRIFENFGSDEIDEQDDSYVSEDDQDKIGSRRDYSVFMCNMNEEFCTFRSYNYKTEYDLHSNRVEIHNQLIEDYRKKWSLGLSPKLIKFPSNNFPMYFPAEYLKEMCGSQIYDNSDYLRALRVEKDCWNKYKNVFGEENRLSYCILLCYRIATDEIVRRRIFRDMQFGGYNLESKNFDTDFDKRCKEEAARLEMFRSMYRQIAEEKPFDPESYALTNTELTICSLQAEKGVECFRNIEIIQTEEPPAKTTECTSNAQLMENLSQPLDRTKIRVSMDEGFYGSRSGSPIPLTDLDGEAHRWNPVVSMFKLHDTPNVVMDEELKLMLGLSEKPVFVVQNVPLNVNKFLLPEHILRKMKIFKLPEEFDIWINARKRKGATINEAGPTKKRLFEKIPENIYLGEDDAEVEDFLGFEDQLTSSPLKPLETTSQNNSENESNVFSQESGYASQLSFNDSDLSSINLDLTESHDKTQKSIVDETMLREAELEEEEENSRIANVENWTEYITPLLSQAKSRSNFNIQKYGEDIITQFPEIGSELSFQSIMENKRPDFTARNFLSMLMLANTENIKITNLNKDLNRPSRSDEIKLELVTRDMFYETNYDMENIPKRVKKSFTHAPLLNILPLGDNSIQSKSYMRKKRNTEDSMLDDSNKRFRAT